MPDGWTSRTNCAVRGGAKALPGAATLIAAARVRLAFLWRHGRLPDLDDPILFNELVQVRKLRDHDRRFCDLTDKLLVKTFVAERIGAEWINPTLWSGSELPAEPSWPLPFVLKSRRGSNQNAFFRTGEENWRAARRRALRWQRAPYGRWLDEWAYRHIAPGLLVERFIGRGGRLPIDYKFFVFGGRAEFVQVHLNREFGHYRIIFDRNWRRVSTAHSSDTGSGEPPPPAALPRMMEAAECLGQSFDFVRVDLYDADPHPLFGEMTFYPGSGLDPFEPTSLDALFGACWLRALPNKFGAPLL